MKHCIDLCMCVSLQSAFLATPGTGEQVESVCVCVLSSIFPSMFPIGVFFVHPFVPC